MLLCNRKEMEEKIKTILIDDEPLARQELRYMLGSYPEIDVIAEADNVDTAIEKIKLYQPHLIFLDVNMPEKTGFDLLAELDTAPIVIFLTAYDQFAIKAFEENALDYLLKPTKTVRLNKALEKVKEELLKRNNLYYLLHQQLFLKDGDKCFFVKLKDIYLLESRANYTVFYFNNTNCTVHRTMKQVEEALPVDIFFRANRQQIIGMQHITNVENHYKGGLTVTVKNKKIEVSQRSGVEFKAKRGI
jgi:two-component system, LytTR family, response regulator